MEFEVVKLEKDKRNSLVKFLDIFFCFILFRHNYAEAITLNTKTGDVYYEKECSRCGWSWWQL